MTTTISGLATQQLSLPDELILTLLNEESGYFHQVPGWDLNCAVVGAALAELSLLSRIDTDMASLYVVDPTDTGNPILDPILEEIAREPVHRNAQYWIERLAPRAESIIDLTLDRLVDLKILEYHSGDFWTLSPTAWRTDLLNDATEGTAASSLRPASATSSSTMTFPTPGTSLSSVWSIPATSFASCSRWMTPQRSESSSFATWM